MSIIIDANTTPHFKNNSEEVQYIVNWIISGKGRLETGGRNLEEIKACSLRKVLLTFSQAGRVKISDAKAVKRKQDALDQTKMNSDDPHVIALAQASECRLLFSFDKPLHKDFTGKHFLQPKGKVFQSVKKHGALLKGAKKVKAR